MNYGHLFDSLPSLFRLSNLNKFSIRADLKSVHSFRVPRLVLLDVRYCQGRPKTAHNAIVPRDNLDWPEVLNTGRKVHTPLAAESFLRVSVDTNTVVNQRTFKRRQIYSSYHS